MLIQEWKNLFKNKIMVLSVFVLALIPIIYAGILLSSYWDPFGKTSNLAVAVVNHDKAQLLEGNEINIGKELVENLKKNDDFDWHFVDAKTAQKGYEESDYYIVITIPEDFSKNATTVLEPDVKKMNLEYQVNPGRNYFIETVGKQAMANITNEISQSVTKEYAKTIFSVVEDLGDGLADAADGASQIDEGTQEIHDGSNTLAENLKKLASSTLTFQSGTEKLEVGVKELAKGANQLKDGAISLHNGITQYTDGINQLQQKTSALSDPQNGVPKLAAGQTSLNEGLKRLEQGSRNLQGGLQSLNNSLPANEDMAQLSNALLSIQQSIATLEASIQENPEASEELKTQLATLKAAADAVQPKAAEALGGYNTVKTALEGSIIPGATQLNTGLTSAVNGSNQLTTATNELSGNLPALSNAMNVLVSKGQELKQGASTLSNGTSTLATSIPTLANGVAQLANGSSQLSDASGRLRDGSVELSDGLVTLKEGTKELATQLQDGATEVGDIKTNETNHDMIASPVEIDEKKENDVPNYGHALAPNFISLALFIGAIAFNLIFPIATPSMKPTSAFSWWFSKFSIIFVQATSSALILDAILLGVIRLEVQDKGLFIGMSILVSLTYMSLVSFLVMALDNPGRFIATILMVLQVASSGGMFPTELQSSFFQSINPYMLMTYSVFGFREAMTDAVSHSVFLQSVIVLGSVLLLSNLFMFLTAWVKKKFKRYPKELEETNHETKIEESEDVAL